MNSMMDILNLLEELLEHDPGSKIFFPLARLYRKQGDTHRASEIIRKGIIHHPDYLEAQLFQVELLHEIGVEDEAASVAGSVIEKLLGYERFWMTLKQSYLVGTKSNLALAAHIFEREARNEKVDLMSLCGAGLEYQAMQPLSDVQQSEEPEFDLDADEVTRFCLNSGIKTKTMAKLFASQGEFSQALEIYDELLSGSVGENERMELTRLRNEVHAQLMPSDVAGVDKGKKLFHMLNSLATRLEGRTS